MYKLPKAGFTLRWYASVRRSETTNWFPFYVFQCPKYIQSNNSECHIIIKRKYLWDLDPSMDGIFVVPTAMPYSWSSVSFKNSVWSALSITAFPPYFHHPSPSCTGVTWETGRKTVCWIITPRQVLLSGDINYCGHGKNWKVPVQEIFPWSTKISEIQNQTEPQENIS